MRAPSAYLPPIPNHIQSLYNRYAFLEFEDARDANEAMHEMQGRRFDGSPLVIQVRAFVYV